MTLAEALAAFLLAAGLLTVTPGLDTMLVLRTAASEGRRPALLAMLGIQLGCLVWGAAVALGLGALLTASMLAYRMITWAGAAYLVWIGATLLMRPRQQIDPGASAIAPADESGGRWLWRGLLTNVLNPKIGVFYVSFLPQFVPVGWSPAPTIFGLAALHVLLATLWLSALVLGMGPLRAALRRPAVVTWLDRLTGAVFIAFGLRLAFSRAV